VSADEKLGLKMKSEAKLTNVSISDIEGPSRDEVEERERKKDSKRQKLHKKSDLPGHIDAVNKMNDPEMLRRRTKMQLPSPQVSDRELEEVAKLDSGALALAAIGGSTPTKTLLASYGNTTATPMRSARTPMGRTCTD